MSGERRIKPGDKGARRGSGEERPRHVWAKCPRCESPMEFYVAPDGPAKHPYGGNKTGWWRCPRERECKNEPSVRSKRK